MSLAAANTVHAAARPMVGAAVVRVCAPKRNERIGQPDTGTGGPHH